MKRLANIVCPFCRVRRPNNAGKLCRQCYTRPAARAAFPPLAVYARRGPGSDNRIPTRLPRPVAALPGTLRKVDVMARRVERGEALFHKEDAKRD